MNTIDDFMRQYPQICVTEEQATCCRVLQREGQRFLIDFGYQNAPDKVWQMIDDEIEALEFRPS